jgi:hypothetical protein
LEALIMERQPEAKGTYPLFAQQLIDRGKLEGLREGRLEGIREGKLEGLLEGRVEGRVDGTRRVLLRLLELRGIALGANARDCVNACTDLAILDRWVDNVLDAKTAADVLS